MKAAFTAIFDMDGVLVDNFNWHLKAWEAFCKRHKKHISDEEFRTHVFGGNNPDHLKYIFGQDISPELIEQYSLEKEQLYRDLYAGNIQAVNGLLPLLDELRANHITMAVATSAERRNVDFILEAIGCSGYFSVIADASMISKGKPDPEVFLKAAELSKADINACIVFEDSLKGIEAALRAQMKVVGVATTHHYAELTEAHHVITDFTEIDYSGLCRLIKHP
jgi:beta-phosphoglucomutase family hydrolase